METDGSLSFHGSLPVVHTFSKTSVQNKFAYVEEGQFLPRNPMINLEYAVQARSLLAGLWK
jgi:hypothetical protein